MDRNVSQAFKTIQKEWDRLESSFMSNMKKLNGNMPDEKDLKKFLVNFVNQKIAQIQSDDDTQEALDQIFKWVKEPTGWVDRDEATLSWDDGTRTLTITPVNQYYQYFIKGRLFRKSTAESIQIANTEGLTYIYYDGALLTQRDTFDDGLIFSLAYTSAVYWDATNNKAVYVADERHGANMSGNSHYHFHNAFGTQYYSGLTPGGFTPDQSGDNPEDAMLTVTDGVIADEDIIFPVSGYTGTPPTTYAEIPVVYREGADGNWRIDDPQIAPVKNATTGSLRLAWNELTGGVWTQTEVANNDFVLAHVFALNDIRNGLIAIQGQSDYTTLGRARDGALVELNALILNGLPFKEFKPICTIIYQTGNGYDNAVKARVRTNNDGGNYIDWRFTSVSNLAIGSVAGDHNNLPGLQGGQANEYYHFTESQHTGLITIEGLGAGTIPNGDGAGGLGASSISQSAGKINIGGNNYDELLNLQGIGASMQLLDTAGVVGAILGTETTDEGFLELKDTNVTKINFNAKANEDSYIDNGGNLGIGTDSPSAKFHINVNSNDSSISSNGFFAGSNNYGVWIGNSSSSGFQPTLRMRSEDSSDSNYMLYEIESADDTGTTDVAFFNARNTFGGSINNRPLYSFKNDGLSAFEIKSLDEMTYNNSELHVFKKRYVGTSDNGLYCKLGEFTITARFQFITADIKISSAHSASSTWNLLFAQLQLQQQSVMGSAPINNFSYINLGSGLTLQLVRTVNTTSETKWEVFLLHPANFNRFVATIETYGNANGNEPFSFAGFGTNTASLPGGTAVSPSGNLSFNGINITIP
jgi:hypothetical protein